jgi:hypothetical protein
MAKYRNPGAKKTAPVPRAGLPCLIIVIAGLIGLFVLLILVMKYAGS